MDGGLCRITFQCTRLMQKNNDALIAAWFRFDTGQSAEVECAAMVGEKKWKKWLAKIGSWFMRERVRYFDDANREEAERCVRAG